MSPNLRVLRFGVLLVLSLASLAMAWANGLGYLWSGAWGRPLGVAVAAAYLPSFFALAWLLVAASRLALVKLLWTTSGIALLICTVAVVLPSLYPLKVTAADFVVVVLLPLGGHLYRYLLNYDRPVRRIQPVDATH